MKLFVTGIIIAMMIAFPPNASRCENQPDYRIAAVAWMGWSPLHVAQEKGFWSEQGINVEVVHFDNPVILLEAIRAGRIHFAMDMVGTLVGEYSTGREPVCFMETNWSDGGDKIIIQQGKKIEEQVGLPLGVFLDQPSILLFLGRYLSTKGMKLENFRIVEIGAEDLAAQFVAGRIPAIVIYEPLAQIALDQGRGTLLATSADFEGCIPEGIWAYRKTLDTTPREDLKKILSGWIKAVEWLHAPENREEFYSILRRRTFSSETTLTDEELNGLFENVRIHRPEALLERNRNGGGLYLYLDNLKTFLRENDRLKRNYNPRKIFDNRIVMDVLSRYTEDRN